MQEENSNNFDTIITTWRRLSGEEIVTASESTARNSSNSFEMFKNKEEDMDFSQNDKSKVPNHSIASASTIVMVADAATDTDTDLLDDEGKELFKHNTKDESKEAAGDVKDNKDSDYLEGNNDNTLLQKQSAKIKMDDQVGDNVDSVYLRPPPPSKTRSQESPNDEDSCAMTCLYCVVTSCDCVLM